MANHRKKPGKSGKHKKAKAPKPAAAKPEVSAPQNAEAAQQEASSPPNAAPPKAETAQSEAAPPRANPEKEAPESAQPEPPKASSPKKEGRRLLPQGQLPDLRGLAHRAAARGRALWAAVQASITGAPGAPRMVPANRTRRPLFSRQSRYTVPSGREPSLSAAANTFRKETERREKPLIAALLVALLPLLLLLLERAGVPMPAWAAEPLDRSMLLLICLAAEAALCREAFFGSAGAFLCGVSVIAAACDCLARAALTSRSGADTYGAAACLGLAAAQWGVSLESRALFETFRAASLDDDPPWLVTDAAPGACKQRGTTRGFYTSALSMNPSSAWQTALLPVILASGVVFAALSSLGQGRPADFFLNLSILLAAGATLPLPLCWGLPWARLANRLHRDGGAVAGWDGAERVSRRRVLIITDRDLFPAGAARLDGASLFRGTEMREAVTLAASMVQAASCALLEQVFEDLVKQEESQILPVEEFNFYEEGGYGGEIGGESVLLGTAAFLRRMEVPLPRELNVPHGVLLAVNHRLAASFTIKYLATDNVRYALGLLRRAGVTPVLASRDPNVTPALLERKFRQRMKVRYPSLAERVALSETEFDRGRPDALLFREGLLLYAETVAGSRRLCQGVRRATVLALLGSAAGMLLTFYLVFQGKYDLLTPLALVGFLLLWAVPCVVLMDLF